MNPELLQQIGQAALKALEDALGVELENIQITDIKIKHKEDE